MLRRKGSGVQLKSVGVGVSARTAEEQGEGKKKAKAKKKADVEKLGWGIGFKELIARVGIDVNDAEQMDGAELLL